MSCALSTLHLSCHALWWACLVGAGPHMRPQVGHPAHPSPPTAHPHANRNLSTTLPPTLRMQAPVHGLDRRAFISAETPAPPTHLGIPPRTPAPPNTLCRPDRLQRPPWGGGRRGRRTGVHPRAARSSLARPMLGAGRRKHALGRSPSDPGLWRLAVWNCKPFGLKLSRQVKPGFHGRVAF